MLARFLTAATLTVLSACAADARDERPVPPRGSARPDELPIVVNKVLPFRYPASLYARKVQGNVTLRLFIDADGRVHADSTRVDESSGEVLLDSAAVTGSRDLHFVPAKLHGDPMAVVVLFPVYFRHPEAAPLPGDTLLSVRQP